MANLATVQQMLGDLTPADFICLPRDARDKVYQRHLVKTTGHVIIDEADDDDSLNPTIAKGVILRQEYFVGSDVAGCQIAEEARETYYTQNSFQVRSHWLCEFLSDSLANGESVPVEGLIRKITVMVDLQHPWEAGAFTSKLKNKKDKGKPEAVCDLEHLLKLKKAEWIGIKIEGGGAIDGSDLKTQQKIKEICNIIKKLINQFGGRFTIAKVRRSGGPFDAICHDIKAYWKRPTDQAKKRLQNGAALFEEIMQIQIEEWMRKVSRTITEEDLYWESLL